MKKHDILIEPWRGNPGPRSQKGSEGFRWTVSYEKEGRFYAQGFADSHAEARAAAEAYLKEQGVDLNWQSTPSNSVKVLRPRSRSATARGASRT
jgi:hypothetical protein